MRVRSVTYRLTLFFSTVSTAVLLAVGYLVGALVESHFIEQDMNELDGTIELVGNVLAKVHFRSDLDPVPQLLNDALVGFPGLSIKIVGPEGRTLFASSDTVFAANPMQDKSNNGFSGQRGPLVRESGGHAFREIVAAMPLGIAGIPPAKVFVAVNIDHQRDFMAALRRILWLSIAAGMLLTGVLAWIAARRGLEPIRRIAALAHKISASRLDERLALDQVPPELSDLASALNAMLARLEDSFRRLSDFSSDLAHELRTPVGNLVTETEVALSRARSADEYREVLYSNLEEFNRLSRMIGDMLFLAKADNGLIVPRQETVDLALETQGLFAFYEALAEERGVGLALEGAGTISGDRLMIRRALSNLLSNALRHTLRGNAVKVSIEQPASGETRLAITNPGEDIAAEQLSRLFDRFYRVDASRQKTSEGAGLGLAITKSIVEAHQGSIMASSANGTIRFEIRFPPGAPA
ncbi:MAG: HAMP domain-containing protein [Betaproteobacteria bacterium]|nr:MAG: HAMP domain-containing protein [Betaproteobacteria bacterium]